MMTRIFEPYVTTKPRGTGLGLAVVKKIIDEHHGTIAIENRPQRGACVSVLLPVTDEQGAASKAA
jgi:nitrogen fixation/metabolism regulation signal transduction histidine kinase